MKIIINNLGPIKSSEIELGDLTIICGNNNSGKTYITYTIYGFLKYGYNLFKISIPKDKFKELINNGFTKIELKEYYDDINNIIDNGCLEFKSKLPSIFATNENNFTETEILLKFNIDSDSISSLNYTSQATAYSFPTFEIKKEKNNQYVTISIISETPSTKISNFIAKRIIERELKRIIFSHLLPSPFITSVERTGAAIFRKELNFSRSKILESLKSDSSEIISQFIAESYIDYPLPVRDNVEFSGQLEDISKKISFIAKKHPSILEDFTNLIGGNYSITEKSGLHFITETENKYLTLDASSSAVRSLLDISFYIKHLAKPGDLLMIDEPELNLHPSNQRKIARLLARLVNVGIKVFITTHSDYIIREFNTLLLLNKKDAISKKVQKEENYKDEELLSSEKVRVYTTKCENTKAPAYYTLINVDIQASNGINIKSFDDTIEKMNAIQDKLIWG